MNMQFPSSENGEGSVRKFKSSKSYWLIKTFVSASAEALSKGHVPMTSNHSFRCLSQEVRSPIIGLVNLLRRIDRMVQSVKVQPDTTSGARFGNSAFRDFHQRLRKKSDVLTSELLLSTPFLVDFGSVAEDVEDEENHPFEKYQLQIRRDLGTFLESAFGNPQRLDYGTGHELNFLCFLTSLWRLNFFGTDSFDMCLNSHRFRPDFTDSPFSPLISPSKEVLRTIVEESRESDASSSDDEDTEAITKDSEAEATTVSSSRERNSSSIAVAAKPYFEGSESQMKLAAIVSVVFHKYIHVVRHVQQKFHLEPAGSKGVWGLDDFNFLPFLWGAFQVVPDGRLLPHDVNDPKNVEKWATMFLYFDSIRHLRMVKSGAPFGETSPLLYDISSLPSWQRVGLGLLRMYDGEVLSKFPIVQHFFYSKILEG